MGVSLGASFRKDKIVTIAYFGDGGTSSNDFHSSLNFASVFKTPTVFFCRNNGYAISVPVSRQTASKTLSIKGVAYNMESIRIDGNDPLQVYSATRKALDKARNRGGPTLIEAVTYRLGSHSTSDDPKRYREQDEFDMWKKKDPLSTFRLFLEKQGLWSDDEDLRTKQLASDQVKEAVHTAEQLSSVAPESIVEDVYSAVPWNLDKQLHEYQEEAEGD